jgi:tetratricopeptide (TPR) repeat protein
MSEEHRDGSETFVQAVSRLCARAEALHCAGRLDDAAASFAALDLTDGATEPARLRISLAQGKLFTDRVFHANRGYDAAVATLEASRALADQLGDALSGAIAMDLMGFADYYCVMQAGGTDYGTAVDQFETALARREALGDSRGVAESLFHIGLVHERLENYDQAQDFYRRAYALARERGHLLEQSYASRHLGGAAQAMGDLDAALAFFGESLALRQEVGYTLLLPLAHIALGETLLARNNADGAAGEYARAYALAQGMQSPLIMVSSLLALSELAQARGSEDLRHEYAEQALSRAQEDDLPIGVRGAEAALAAIARDRT